MPPLSTPLLALAGAGLEPGPAAAVLASAVVYAAGTRRAWATAGRGRIVRRSQVAFAAVGLVAVGVAIASPLDAAADRSLTAHMIQHVLLLSLAGPCLALGGAVPAVAWSLPAGGRRWALGLWRRAVHSQSRRWGTWVAAGIAAQSVVMWVWHAPALYDAALAHAGVHLAEHVMFVLSSGLLWWALAGGRTWRRGGATIATFVAAFPGTALGAALLLAPRPWYPPYAHPSVTAALADQQLAGVVMWAFAGLTYVIGAAVLVGTWLAASERDEPAVVVPPWPGPPEREEVGGALPSQRLG